MKQWVGNAHGEQSVRCRQEKRVGRFDTRGGSIRFNQRRHDFYMPREMVFRGNSYPPRAGWLLSLASLPDTAEAIAQS